MYNDVGWKIKGIAKVLGVVLLAAGVIAWMILITNKFPDRPYYNVGEYIKEDDIFGWLALVAGVLGYFSTWFIYGFGQLIEDTEAIRECICYQKQAPQAPSQSIIKKVPMQEDCAPVTNTCISCGAKREGNSPFCTSCGQRF